ncbi:MAG: molybdopterin-dependent oxidoreductase [Burkholderiales bacterium]|nr:molybdopterin-dependent oxidoreductase [Burkholderiales bacterium]
MTKFGIGQAITRREDQRLLTGTGQYLDDMSLPNEAHVAFVRSPHAHARIASIDTGAATSAPGVLAVLTGAQLKADGIGHFPINPGLTNAAGKPMTAPPYYPLAVDEARFVGEAVAAVVAQTRQQALDAVEQVQVDYEELPVVVSIEQAMAADAPQVWADAPGNVAAQTEFGDQAATDAGFAKAKHVSKIHFTNQRLVPVSMEPRGSIGDYDQASGRLLLYTSCQNPAGLQKTLAEAIFKVPAEQVRVRVGDVGGGFGMKTMLYAEDAVCVYAARKLGRPAHWRATRSEEFLAGTHGRDQINDAELAFDADGKILGFRVNIVGNVGAYACSPGAVIVVAVGPKVITGVYHIPALHLKARAFLTNTNIVSAYRGAGRPEAIYLIERLMDQAAAEMKMDPAELRRRIGAVFQDFVRYQFSAAENVGLGEPSRLEDRARIAGAVERAGAAGVVAGLPQGYDTVLGGWFERGHELSAGQWQKLAVARAFMRDDAELLILDEPTASIDAEAEHELFERFRQLSADRTAIVISHRFSTVRLADRIAVLHGGRLEELGSHRDLLARDGRYAHLFRLQAQGYLD